MNVLSFKNRKANSFGVFVASALFLFGCGSPTPSAVKETPAATASAPSTPSSPALMNPSQATEKAPNLFKVSFKTTKGEFVLAVHRDWAPLGADRFYNLVKIGYYDQTIFFRVVPNFVVQWGVNGSPQISAAWRAANIPDDPAVGQSNKRGSITYAMGGPNTRTTQVFINLRDNSNLDSMGFTPFGEIVQGMDIVDGLYGGYGDGPPYGSGPDQGRLQTEGNNYVKPAFPLLDSIQSAQIVP